MSIFGLVFSGLVSFTLWAGISALFSFVFFGG